MYSERRNPEKCSSLTIKTPQRHSRRRSNAFLLNLQQFFIRYSRVLNLQTLIAIQVLNLRTLIAIQVLNLQTLIAIQVKVNNRNTRKRCETCSKLKIKIPKRCHWRVSVVFIVNFEHVSHLFLVFL